MISKRCRFDGLSDDLLIFTLFSVVDTDNDKRQKNRHRGSGLRYHGSGNHGNGTTSIAPEIGIPGKLHSILSNIVFSVITYRGFKLTFRTRMVVSIGRQLWRREVGWSDQVTLKRLVL